MEREGRNGRRGRAAARRGAVVVAALALALALPATAWAAFRSVAGANATVGTLTLATPAGVTFTTWCPTGTNKTGGVSVSAFTEVARATGYVLELDSPVLGNASTTVSGSQALQLKVDGHPNKGRWQLLISSQVGTWTSAPLVRTFDC